MAFRFDKLTIKAQEAVQRAQEAAADRGNPQIEPMHLLAGLVAETEGVIRPVLDKIGANRGQLDKIIEAELKQLPTSSGGAPPQPSSALMQVFDAAAKQAELMKDEFVSTEHLLLALAKTDSKAKQILKLNAIGETDILKALQTVRGSARVEDQNPEAKFQALEKYGIDLVERAKQGKLDPVIGRDQEIRRVMQVLSRRTKNNPVLIGEPGVGKTAIAEGLAPAHRARGRAAKPEEQPRHRPGYGGLDRRHQVSRRIRRAAQGRAQRSPSRRHGHPVHR